MSTDTAAETPQSEQSAGQPTLQPAPPRTELSAQELRFRVSFPDDFQTTADLQPPGHDFVGQDRAEAALELGLGIPSRGFHIFVSGLSGAQKLDVLHRWVAQQATQAETLGDWVYVHNFADPDVPRAISLQTGQGCQLQARMHQLVKALQEELPKAFREEAFDKEKDELKEKIHGPSPATELWHGSQSQGERLPPPGQPTGHDLDSSH